MVVFQIADDSGSVFCAFNKETAKFISEGDVLYLLNYSFNRYKQRFILFEGSKSCTKVIGKYFFEFSLHVNRSKQFNTQT
jgi:hypothetical protein